jgi:hypothetical protein
MTPRSIEDERSKTSHASPPFEGSAIELAKNIQSSFKAIEDLVIGAYAHTSLWQESLRVERNAVTAAAINLNVAWCAMQSELRDAIHPASEESGSVIPSYLHPQYLSATSLLQASGHIWKLQ